MLSETAAAALIYTPNTRALDKAFFLKKKTTLNFQNKVTQTIQADGMFTDQKNIQSM